MARASDIRYGRRLDGVFMATQGRDGQGTTAIRAAWNEGDYRRVGALASSAGPDDKALVGATTIDRAALVAGGVMFLVVVGLFLGFVGRG